jgi:uncharacterized protein (UPF0335 family)
MLFAMKRATDPPEQIGELIDRIERIREELLTIQNSMEQMEPPESIASHDDTKD